MTVFTTIDNLYNLRRARFINQKKKKYQQEQIRKREEEIKNFKSLQKYNNQQEDKGMLDEKTEQQLMKLIDLTDDGALLIKHAQTHFSEIADNLEI